MFRLILRSRCAQRFAALSSQSGIARRPMLYATATVSLASVLLFCECTSVRADVIPLFYGATVLTDVTQDEQDSWPTLNPRHQMIDLQIAGGGKIAELHVVFDDHEGNLVGTSAIGSATGGTVGESDAFSIFRSAFEITDESTPVHVTWSGTRDQANGDMFVQLEALSPGPDPLPFRLYNTEGDLTSVQIDEHFMLTPGRYAIGMRARYNAEFDLGMRFGAARWREAVSGNFSDAERWTGGIVPTEDDELIFDAVGDPYTVTFDDSYTAQGVLVRRGMAELNLASNTLTVDDFTVMPGPNDTVSLTISGGDGGPVGVTSFPYVPLGGGPILTNGDPRSPPQMTGKVLDVSGGTNAEVNISASSSFDSVRLNARTTVSGSETLMDVGSGQPGHLVVGRLGSTGFLAIDEGARLVSYNDMVIGEGTGSDGTVVVENGAILLFDAVTVGKLGRGEIIVRPEGSAEFISGLTIGADDSPGGRVTVQANRSEGKFGALRIGGTLDVGGTGVGELLLLGGEVIRHQVAPLFVDVGQNGSIHVDERGQMTVQELNIGTGTEFNFSTVRISDGSLLHVSAPPGEVNLGKAFVGVEGLGRVIVEGTSAVDTSRLQIDRELEIGLEGVVEVLGHSFVTVGQSAGGTIGEVIVGPGGVLKGEGAIGGNLRIAGGVTDFHGSFLPGTSPGTFTVDGRFQLEQGGILEIEFAGTSDAEYDRVVVSGDADVDGMILLKFIEDFAPSQGDTFSFLDVGGMMTTGPNIQYIVQNLAPGFEFDISFAGGALMMTALNDGVLVPEPTALWLTMVGVLTLGARRRRVAPRKNP